MTNQIFVATPMYNGMCHRSYTASLLRLVSIFMNAGVGLCWESWEGGGHDVARDTLVHNFMQTEGTHLMFIDGDIGFKAEDILSMMVADKDIIGGLFPRKLIVWEQVAEAVKNGVPPQELHRHAHVYATYALDGKNITTRDGFEPFEVAYMGTGFMLIKREVLEGLADKVRKIMTAAPKSTSDFGHSRNVDPDSGFSLSEDYHFCKLARQHGYTVWAAPWVELDHTGSYTFSG